MFKPDTIWMNESLCLCESGVFWGANSQITVQNTVEKLTKHISRVCLLLGAASQRHVGCDSPVHSTVETLGLFHRAEQWSFSWCVPYTNTCTFFFVDDFTRVETFQTDRQTGICFELTEDIHPKSAHTACILIFCSLWQSLKPPWTSVTHHLFPSTSCFCASSATPNATVHEYANMWVSLCMWLAFGSNCHL